MLAPSYLLVLVHERLHHNSLWLRHLVVFYILSSITVKGLQLLRDVYTVLNGFVRHTQLW